MDRNWIDNLPKVDLHCHLDGSIPLATLEAIAEKDSLVFDANKAVAPDKCTDLADYLTCFDAILPLLQTAENLELGTYALVESLAAEQVQYAEIRFAPLLHRHQGLTIAQVILAVCQGISRARQEFDIQVNLIISGMRHHSEEQNLSLVQEAIQQSFPYLVAFDAAGDEASYDNQVVANYIKAAKEAGFAISLHSGECGCAHNVYEAMQLGASRIGHGVAIADNPKILNHVVQEGIVLELCPISNLQTNAIPSWSTYPLQFFLDQGVKCTINTDNRTVSQTTLTREFLTLSKQCGLTRKQVEKLSYIAIEASFADEVTKSHLRDRLDSYLRNE
ncbi:adenosine deaminase [Streptococcus moroccensis]|uniref:adenosine deaminase n=1 Tax=Streptococcus moroccensis TaxID=1451356 RepID=A0ABT9YR66_9STRE|nr:adenosine deaminase [Streptococcus moroccensis]MDQ0222488.1 adenosine deaminase [Streptococcus moroccensis]